MVLPIRSIKNSKEIEELLTAMKLTSRQLSPIICRKCSNAYWLFTLSQMETEKFRD
jgi:hypothetical protein